MRQGHGSHLCDPLYLPLGACDLQAMPREAEYPMSGWRIHFVAESWQGDAPNLPYWKRDNVENEAQTALCGKVCFRSAGTGEGTGSNRREEITCKRCLAKLGEP